MKMNYKLRTGAGDSFNNVSANAKDIANDRNFTVEFDFNGVKCLVNSTTNLEWLYRDYCNSWIMKWKEVGADCVEDYSDEIKLELKRREDIAEEKRKKEEVAYKERELEQRSMFEEKVKNVNMGFKSESDWKMGKENNKDEYGSCIYEYAEGWAKLMQAEILNGMKVKDVAESTSREMSFLGISGYMYGAAVSILSECWLYGEDLRKWHNKEYNHEGEGVVNPAILTIN